MNQAPANVVQYSRINGPLLKGIHVRPHYSLLFTVALCIMLLIQACSQPDSAEKHALYTSGSLRLYAKHWGRFANGYPWELRMEPDREVVLTVYKKEGQVQRSFSVPKDRVSALITTLSDNEYYHLPDVIGKNVPDGGVRTLRINIGDREKTVTIYSLRNNETPEELTTKKRAARVWACVRALFEDKDGFDIRDYESDLVGKE